MRQSLAEPSVALSQAVPEVQSPPEVQPPPELPPLLRAISSAQMAAGDAISSAGDAISRAVLGLFGGKLLEEFLRVSLDDIKPALAL